MTGAECWYTGDQKAWLEGPAKNIHNRRIQYLKKTLGDLKTSYPRILDAGCGDGVMTNVIQKILPTAYIIGVDYNQLRIDRAKKAVPTANFFKGDLHDLDCQDNYFDIVFMHHVMEHIKDDKHVLEELTRVLKPEGMLMVSVPNEGTFLNQLRNNVIQPKILETTDHVHFYTAKSLAALVNKIEGLKLDRIDTIGGCFVPYHGVHMMLVRSKLVFDVFDLAARIFPEFADSLFLIAKKGGTMFDVMDKKALAGELEQ